LRQAGAILHGRLDGDQVSNLLAEAQYGVLAYRGDALAKSSVFAAYCAHGVCPIVLANQAVTFDGLKCSLNFLEGLPQGRRSTSAATAVGHSAWKWYQSHRVECHSAAVLSLLAAVGKTRLEIGTATEAIQ
jgi:hypothetical protein